MDEELKPQSASPTVAPEGAAKLVAERAATARAAGPMPAIYIGHGAPLLVDDAAR